MPGSLFGSADDNVIGPAIRSVMNTQPRYEIRIAGQLDEAASALFAGLDVTCRDEVTIITGDFDQAALHGLLERIRQLGLDLLEARRVRASPRRAPE